MCWCCWLPAQQTPFQVAAEVVQNDQEWTVCNKWTIHAKQQWTSCRKYYFSRDGSASRFTCQNGITLHTVFTWHEINIIIIWSGTSRAILSYDSLCHTLLHFSYVITCRAACWRVPRPLRLRDWGAILTCGWPAWPTGRVGWDLPPGTLLAQTSMSVL